MNKPLIGITMGDPKGIGPEVILKSVKKNQINRLANFLIIGDLFIIESLNRKFKFNLKIHRINNPDKAGSYKISLYHIGGKNIPRGIAQAKYIDKAVEFILNKKLDALVTAPVNKASINSCGIRFSGHTEYIANLSNVKDPVMMFTSKFFKLALVTTHLPIKSVPKSITVAKVYHTIKLAYIYGRRYFGIKSPKIAVCGLNPHAGENGVLGKEEKEFIMPAIYKLKRDFPSIRLYGTLPADTLFYHAYNKKYDVVVSMFHDQGLAPLKMIDFRHCVNITLGLPFIRTSPSHGTAPDLAGKGIADSSSMEEAIKMAGEMYRRG